MQKVAMKVKAICSPKVNMIIVLLIVSVCRSKVAYNGSADLRSPEKEVYFRSWDFANSQMCEVRVATSNICGCNSPNRCGKSSGADFATSEKVFAKGGLNLTASSISTERSKLLFQIVKLQKNTI